MALETGAVNYFFGRWTHKGIRRCPNGERWTLEGDVGRWRGTLDVGGGTCCARSHTGIIYKLLDTVYASDLGEIDFEQ